MAVARDEVQRKGERQRLAQQQRAEKNKPAKGIRPTGYTLCGEVVEAEAAIIRRIFDRFTAGDTLRGIAAELQRDRIRNRRGAVELAVGGHDPEERALQVDGSESAKVTSIDHANLPTGWTAELDQATCGKTISSTPSSVSFRVTVGLSGSANNLGGGLSPSPVSQVSGSPTCPAQTGS